MPAHARLLLALLVCGCGTDAPRSAEDTKASADSPATGVGDVAHQDSGEVPVDTAHAATAPADVIRRYYAAIDERDYPTAYALWGDEGARSGQSYDEFAAGFAQTARVTVELGEPGRIEGAAGSQYVTVPVEIRAMTSEGAEQRFRGSYTLRRSVVDGATAAQRRWHIEAADISTQ